MRLLHSTSDSVSLVTLDNYNQFDKLEPWIYRNPTYDEPSKVLKLDKAESLYSIPKKMYGNADSLAKTILNDYSPKGDVLGALLIGKKGMGKSMLSELMAMKMLDKGIPVIHVTREVDAVAIEKAVETLAPCMLYLEEFEKCFTSASDVPIFLNMFSSTSIKGLMVVIAANNIDGVAYDPMIDRPQRLRFRIKFGKIDEKTVDEVLSDSEATEDQKQVYREWVKSSNPNIDSLITLVKLTTHIKDPNDLIDYISILNVPDLNPLRYKLKTLRLTEWNYDFISDRTVSIKLECFPDPAAIKLNIQGNVNISNTIDLTVEDPTLGDFTLEQWFEDKSHDGLEIRVKVFLEFELCRDSGKITQALSTTINEEYKGGFIELIKDGKVVESRAKDLSRYSDFF